MGKASVLQPGSGRRTHKGLGARGHPNRQPRRGRQRKRKARARTSGGGNRHPERTRVGRKRAGQVDHRWTRIRPQENVP
eukprot:11245622-Heterocapsa_arctica.AAC.1